MPEVEKIEELVEVSWQCGQFTVSSYVHNTGLKKNSTAQILFIQAHSINSFNEVYS